MAGRKACGDTLCNTAVNQAGLRDALSRLLVHGKDSPCLNTSVSRVASSWGHQPPH